MVEQSLMIITVHNSTFFSNENIQYSPTDNYGYGGAIEAYPGTTLTLDRSNFTANTANGGGAISANGFGTSVYITRTVFDKNYAADAGAIQASGYLSVTDSSTFTGNAAYERGGAILGQSMVEIHSSTVFADNSCNGGNGAGKPCGDDVYNENP
jgi:predicted outer membrane repeat protein